MSELHHDQDTVRERLAAEWSRAQPKLAAYFAMMLPNQNDVDDLVQRVAVAVVRKSAEYDPARPFIKWAMGIARLELAGHWRRRSRETVTFDSDVLDMVTDAFMNIVDDLDPTREALRHCLQELPARSFAALEMRYDRSMPVNHIAREMNITAEAARALMLRARRALRECIARRLEGSVP